MLLTQARSVIAVPVKNLVPDDLCSVVPKSEKSKRFACRHSGPTEFELLLAGREIKVLSQDERCPKCFLQWLRSQSVSCCFCGTAILPDDRVLRYNRDLLAGFNDEVAVSFDAEEKALGCTRVGCCDGLAGFEGFHWDGERLIEKEAF